MLERQVGQKLALKEKERPLQTGYGISAIPFGIDDRGFQFVDLTDVDSLQLEELQPLARVI